MNTIVLKQKPIIEHKIQEAGASVTARLAELDIDNLVATTDTVKTLKELRAELNKELGEYEQQRKFVKDSIAEPYKLFEDLYKENISQKYKDAVDTLKTKIDKVETEIKNDKLEKVKAYFDEVCLTHNLNWLTYSRLNIEINLSTSLKKYKEQVAEIVEKVADDLDMIPTNENHAEILTEYKKDLNVSRAIKEVNERVKKVAEERQRIEKEREEHCMKVLSSEGFTYSEMTKEFVFQDIFINLDDLKTLTDSDLNSYVQRARAKTSEISNVAAPTVQDTTKPENVKDSPKDQLFKAVFQVTGTREKLTELKQFLVDNNYSYENL
jgi:hypothetical protein